MSCKHKMIETKCSTCGIVDRFCKNLCGEGSGHAHATPYQDKAGLLRQLDHQSNKQLIAQIREGVKGLMVPVKLDVGMTSDYVITLSVTINKVLALLEKIEKELA
ncbi:hypothetical protein UFOVP1261_16 [uncultured Caudovirales phage]|uniref:Uncharacterized protein n=1 Tax=uncultured Caudovirales phage TaxID=2100421 RepID=A0A6J5R9I0_9CAUD|nr:hypothetical protein UFOVP1261_16 [uncultured Caudovirales phage]CAB4221952.1 hypothetical protein UFOVP1650_4 [uncultured Caudovirales phage]